MHSLYLRECKQKTSYCRRLIVHLRWMPAPLFNTTLLKVMTYGRETWSPTEAEENMLTVTEKAVERRMRAVPLRDRIDGQTLREVSGVKDIIVAARGSKIRQVGFHGLPC